MIWKKSFGKHCIWLVVLAVSAIFVLGCSEDNLLVKTGENPVVDPGDPPPPPPKQGLIASFDSKDLPEETKAVLNDARAISSTVTASGEVKIAVAGNSDLVFFDPISKEVVRPNLKITTTDSSVEGVEQAINNIQTVSLFADQESEKFLLSTSTGEKASASTPLNFYASDSPDELSEFSLYGAIKSSGKGGTAEPILIHNIVDSLYLPNPTKTIEGMGVYSGLESVEGFHIVISRAADSLGVVAVGKKGGDFTTAYAESRFDVNDGRLFNREQIGWPVDSKTKGILDRIETVDAVVVEGDIGDDSQARAFIATTSGKSVNFGGNFHGEGGVALLYFKFEESTKLRLGVETLTNVGRFGRQNDATGIIAVRDIKSLNSDDEFFRSTSDLALLNVGNDLYYFLVSVHKSGVKVLHTDLSQLDYTELPRGSTGDLNFNENFASGKLKLHENDSANMLLVDTISYKDSEGNDLAIADLDAVDKGEGHDVNSYVKVFTNKGKHYVAVTTDMSDADADTFRDVVTTVYQADLSSATITFTKLEEFVLEPVLDDQNERVPLRAAGLEVAVLEDEVLVQTVVVGKAALYDAYTGPAFESYQYKEIDSSIDGKLHVYRVSL